MFSALCTMRLGAVLDVVGDVEQLADLRVASAGNVSSSQSRIDIPSSSFPRFVKLSNVVG